MKSNINIGAAKKNFNNFFVKANFFLILLVALYSCSSAQESSSKIVEAIDKSTGETVIPRNTNSIYIYPIADKVDRRDMAEKLYVKIRDGLASGGRLAVLPDIGDAELSLQCVVYRYLVEPIEYGNIGRPVRMRLKVFMTVRLYDLKKQKVIFDDPEIQSFREFSDVVPPIETEEQALEALLDNLSKRIMEKTMTGWETKYMYPVEKN